MYDFILNKNISKGIEKKCDKNRETNIDDINCVSITKVLIAQLDSKNFHNN